MNGQLGLWVQLVKDWMVFQDVMQAWAAGMECIPASAKQGRNVRVSAVAHSYSLTWSFCPAVTQCENKCWLCATRTCICSSLPLDLHLIWYFWLTLHIGMWANRRSFTFTSSRWATITSGVVEGGSTFQAFPLKWNTYHWPKEKDMTEL